MDNLPGSIDQSHNTALGDIVAGNKNTCNTSLTFPEYRPSGQLAFLLEKLKSEELAGAAGKQMIDELKRFCEPKEPKPIGVEQKLTDGNRTDLIHFALEAKEQFAKKLALNTFFESAQEIHALLLSKIYTIFCAEITPYIRNGAGPHEIDVLIRQRIIEPILAELKASPFRYYDEHVYGMLYYLTGNCYVKWV